MPIPLIWVEQRDVPSKGTVEAVCDSCGRQSLRDVVVHYVTVVYLFVFGFVKRYDATGTCPSCSGRIALPERQLPPHIKLAIPAVHRFGCAAIAILGAIFGLVMAVVNNTR